jgi:hypothetical protein
LHSKLTLSFPSDFLLIFLSVRQKPLEIILWISLWIPLKIPIKVGRLNSRKFTPVPNLTHNLLK